MPYSERDLPNRQVDGSPPIVPPNDSELDGLDAVTTCKTSDANGRSNPSDSLTQYEPVLLQPLASIRSDDSRLSTNAHHVAALAKNEKGKMDRRDARIQSNDTTRFTFLPSGFDAVIQASSLEDLWSQVGSSSDVHAADHRRGAWWLDVSDPTEEDMETLSKTFAIHPLTEEDIKTREPREKIELFKNYYFLSLSSSVGLEKGPDHRTLAVNVYAIVFRNGILSFTFCMNPHAANVRSRIKELRSLSAATSDWVCYALMDDIVDEFSILIQALEREIEAIEDNFAIARVDDIGLVLLQIHQCRKQINAIRHLLSGKIDVIKSFARRCEEFGSISQSRQLGVYLSDIQDHVVTMMSNLIHFEQILSRVHTNYLGRLSVDSTRIGSGTIKALSKITVIATILVPMHILSSLFGMNVPVPGKDSSGVAWWMGILGAMGGIILFSLIITRLAKLI